ncbi:MAG: YfiT family bacillithiol transferase [Flavobacteriaceae bacterium]
MLDLESLKYPVGQFAMPNVTTTAEVKNWITTIENFPTDISDEVLHLTSRELEYRYRPEGWTIKQVINHCIDSHMNSIVRFKLALTESCPTIKPYEEAAWAELSDTLEYSVEDSLMLLKHIHKRWCFLLKSLSNDDLEKVFVHPEHNDQVTLKENIGIYAWHCQHHLQHIINAKTMKY